MSWSNSSKKLITRKIHGKTIDKQQNQIISRFKKSQIIRNSRLDEIQDETEVLQPAGFDQLNAFRMKSYSAESEPSDAAQWLDTSQKELCHVDDFPLAEEWCYPRQWASRPCPQNLYDFGSCIEWLSRYHWSYKFDRFLSYSYQDLYLHKVLLNITTTPNFERFVKEGEQELDFTIPLEALGYDHHDIPPLGGVWKSGLLLQEFKCTGFELVLRHARNRKFDETAQLLVYIFRPLLEKS